MKVFGKQGNINVRNCIVFQVFQEAFFQEACQNGYVELVRFLTTSEDLRSAGYPAINIHQFNESAFRMACANGHLEVVKFLVDSESLVECGHRLMDLNGKRAQYGIERAWKRGKRQVIRACLLEITPARAWRAPMGGWTKDAEVQEWIRIGKEQRQFQEALGSDVEWPRGLSRRES